MSNMQDFFKKTDLDLSQSGSVFLHTLTENYIAPFISIKVKTKDNASGGCSFTLGTNAPDYDNFMSGELWSWEMFEGEAKTMNNTKRELLANEDLYININQAIGGDVVVDLYGVGYPSNV